MNEITKAIKELQNCANKLNEMASFLSETFADEKIQNPTQPVTLEQVRAVLAIKSQDGLTSKVKDLIQKHGGTKLSDVDPSNYAKLLADAEVL